jgi:hypothetical protein
MKKIYFIFIIIIQAGLSFAQFNPGFFQIRLVNPGGEPGVMRVQMRAVSSVVPASGQNCGDMSFSIWWDPIAHPTIADVFITSSIGGPIVINDLQLLKPRDGNNGGPLGTTADGSILAPFNFPATWIVNRWVNVATVSICSSPDCNPAGAPSGITAADFFIQGFNDQLPNLTVGTDYTPTTGIPLPLNLISFKADKSGDRSAALNWVTTNEENTSHFVVERSFDKQKWSAIGSVAAAGYSISMQQYSFDDVNVYNGKDSKLIVYYRLQMADIDGQVKTSPIETVVFNKTGSATRDFVVYPNPSSDGLQVEWDAENGSQPTKLEFFDLQGKLIYTRNVSDNTNQEYIDFGLTNIQPGLYMLRILNGEEPIHFERIVVSNR